MTPGGTVLVTGATGFLGGHVCGELGRDGVPVRALVRGARAAPAGAREAASVADLTDRAAVREAVRGVDAVVHLAARVHVMSETAADPLAEFRRVNVEGTRVLMEEAADAGATRFVFASSVKAVGEGGDAPWTEATPPAPVDPYGISKLEAEGMVHELAAARGMHAAVLRLPLVYGPGVKANMLRLFQLVDRGVPLPLGGITNRRSMAFAGNVVSAVRSVLALPGAAGETFFVSDGQDLSTPGLIREIARALGRPARLLPVPPALFRTGGRVGDVISRALPFPLTTPAVDRLLGSLAVDSSKLARVTGTTPPFTVREGIERTAAWYRAAGAGAR